MYCPICGKQQVSDQTRFCSGCGFPLTGVSEVIAAGGASPRYFMQGQDAARGESPRRRGVKQGVWLILLCFLAVPIIAIITEAMRVGTILIPIAAVLTMMGGLLRIAYAFLFESSVGPLLAPEDAASQLNPGVARGSLPPQTSVPVNDFRMPGPGHWKETADLVPGSVTESTTRLLEKEQDQ